MKKVKLLGVLAASTMLLAGCANAQPEPEKEAFSETEVATIKSVLLDQEIPFAYHMEVQEYNEEEDLFFVAKGDVVAVEDLKAYTKLLKEKPYSFEYSYVDPEDAYILDELGVEFVESSVNYYYKDCASEGSYVCDNAVVLFGQEAKTNNFLLIGFESICVIDCATYSNGGYGYIADSKDKDKCFSVEDLNEFTTTAYEGVLVCNGLPSAVAAKTDEAYEAAITAGAANYVLPEYEEDTINFIGVEDIQFAYPLFYGSPYSSGFHSNVTLILFGFTEAKYTAYETAITDAGYVLNASSKKAMWKDSSYYEKEVENEGTFVLEIMYDSQTESGKTTEYAFICVDFYPATAA